MNRRSKIPLLEQKCCLDNSLYAGKDKIDIILNYVKIYTISNHQIGTSINNTNINNIWSRG